MSTERFFVMASACCLATLVAGGAPVTAPGDGDPTMTAVAAAPAINYKNLKMKRLNPRIFTPQSGGMLVAADTAEPGSATRARPAALRTRPAALYWVSDADAAAAEWRRGATFRF